MKVLKRITCALGRWLLDNCISIVVSCSALAFIIESVRLWMRSFFSEYYELTFIFISVAFIAGFIIGSCRRFENFYKKYKQDYEEKKEREATEVTRFMHLDYRLKQLIFEVYVKDSVLKDYCSESALKDDLVLYGTYTTDKYHYMQIELISYDRARITLKDETKKFLKKHPELLDCCK